MNTNTDEAQPTILVVDDNPTNISVLCEYLSELGYRILTATDGVRALKVVHRVKPNIILLDVMMPEMDGFQVCRQLKEDEETRDIPVIFMTALSDASDKVSGFELGAVDYVTKPMQKEEVLMRVKTHLMIDGQRRELEARHDELTLLMEQLQRREGELEEANSKLEQLASVDSLTGMNNRRHFFDLADMQWEACKRNKASLALFLMDVDHFKKYNDHYGHQPGDACLVKVADCIKQSFMRASDVSGRYGGEEFIALAADLSRADAEALADRVHTLLRECHMAHEGSDLFDCVTMSVGMVYGVPGADDRMDAWVHIADGALYEVKENGRNGSVIKDVA